jgi:hypothetical protein
MHLQQTKVDSRATGGPQYYFHDLPVFVKEFIRSHGASPVVLQTPYGIASSSFVAVGKDHKLGKKGKVIQGKVGHDRIQSASGKESIGEAIRFWYGLRTEPDFERVDLEAVIHPAGHFILIPTAVLMRGAKRPKTLEKVTAPLAFHRDYQSKFWKQQIAAKRKESSADVAWAADQIRRVVGEHGHVDTQNVHESDLLRTAGALSILGLDLSLYLCKGYDCPVSRFRFGDLPPYICPVEIKKRSTNFSYQITNYTKLPRAVVLCMKHDLVNPPDHIDVLELSTLSQYLNS